MYHAWILEAVSIYTGQNLNYVMVPPPGKEMIYRQLNQLGVLRDFGIFYRPAMSVIGFLLTVLLRKVFVDSVLYCIDILRKTQGSKKSE